MAGLDNAGAGTHFYDLSSGAVADSECGGNTWGIFVADSASPTIETNDLQLEAPHPSADNSRNGTEASLGRVPRPP